MYIYILIQLQCFHIHGTYHSISSHLPPLGYTQFLFSSIYVFATFLQSQISASKPLDVGVPRHAGDTIVALLEQHPEWSHTKFTFEEPILDRNPPEYFTASFRTLGTLKGMVVLKKWVRKLASLSGVGDIEWDGVVFKCWLDWFVGLGWRIPLGKILKRHIYLAKRNGGYLVKDAQLAFASFFFKQVKLRQVTSCVCFKQVYDQMLICNIVIGLKKDIHFVASEGQLKDLVDVIKDGQCICTSADLIPKST